MGAVSIAVSYTNDGVMALASSFKRPVLSSTGLPAGCALAGGSGFSRPLSFPTSPEVLRGSIL